MKRRSIGLLIFGAVALTLVAMARLAVLSFTLFQESTAANESPYYMGCELESCIASEDLPEILRIVEATPEIVIASDEQGFTPLHEAARIGSSDVALLLIRRGADVNATDGIGQTPLHWAVKSRDAATVSLLIAEGAETAARDEIGDTPARCAERYGGRRRELLLALLTHGDDSD